MPYAKLRGINIHYETYGSGPALLMLAPGAFDATIEKWSAAGIWKEMRPLETLTDHYTCIAYDRRESGQSGGRVKSLTWAMYAQEAKDLMEYLDIDSAFVLGACMGCSVASAFGVLYPKKTMGLILHWPVGGVRWRANCLGRFAQHVDYVKQNGLDAVVSLARESPSFWNEPAAGLWASLIANDESFAQKFASQDADRYAALVTVMARNLFDTDTAPGAAPEELMAVKVPALIIPGNDPAHATSAARYLAESLPNSQYVDVPVADQTADKVREWIRDFMDANVSVAVG